MKKFAASMLIAMATLSGMAGAAGDSPASASQPPAAAPDAQTPAAQTPAAQTSEAQAPAAPVAPASVPVPDSQAVRPAEVVPAAPVQPAPAAGSNSMLFGGLLLLALAAVVLYRKFQRKDAPPKPAAASSAGANAAPRDPAGIDSAAFLRHAKASFIRMQAAWDKADTDDLRKFTTPQVFAELKTQMEQSGASGTVTEVVSIKTELLGVETVGREYLASVSFKGTIRTGPGEAAPFAEVWNMSKPTNAGGDDWMLAGIQQLS